MDFSEYRKGFPKDVQRLLSDMHETIKKAAPKATETFSYGMPTFYLNGNLVHFAAHARHIGFYPTALGITAFEKDLARYKHAKGSVQFPFDEPLPLALVTKIVKYRVKEQLAKKGRT